MFCSVDRFKNNLDNFLATVPDEPSLLWQAWLELKRLTAWMTSLPWESAKDTLKSWLWTLSNLIGWWLCSKHLQQYCWKCYRYNRIDRQPLCLMGVEVFYIFFDICKTKNWIYTFLLSHPKYASVFHMWAKTFLLYNWKQLNVNKNYWDKIYWFLQWDMGILWPTFHCINLLLCL